MCPWPWQSYTEMPQSPGMSSGPLKSVGFFFIAFILRFTSNSIVIRHSYYFQYFQCVSVSEEIVYIPKISHTGTCVKLVSLNCFQWILDELSSIGSPMEPEVTVKNVNPAATLTIQGSVDTRIPSWEWDSGIWGF